MIYRAYTWRWQVELLFKETKKVNFIPLFAAQQATFFTRRQA